MQTKARLERALRDFVAALTRLKVEFMVIGGLAVQARGYVRATRDIDATVRADQVSFEALVASLRRSHIVPRTREFEELAREQFILLLEHTPTGLPLDVGLAWVDFEQAACKRATAERFGKTTAPVIQLEDLLVLKVLAWRPRDQEDVRNLLLLHPEADTELVAAQVRALAELMELDGRDDVLAQVVDEVRFRRAAATKTKARPRKA